MKPLILFLYIFSAINALAISWLLYKTKNGWLRKLMLFYFGAVSLALMIRFLSWKFNWEGETVTLVVMLPVAITMFALTLYLYDTFKNKTKHHD